MHQTTFIRVGIYFSTHFLILCCIVTSNLTTSISHTQVQAVTVVGGGEFSSPVTVSLREPSDDSISDPPIAAITATVVVIIILLLSLIVIVLVVYFCW